MQGVQGKVNKCTQLLNAKFSTLACDLLKLTTGNIVTIQTSE